MRSVRTVAAAVGAGVVLSLVTAVAPAFAAGSGYIDQSWAQGGLALSGGSSQSVLDAALDSQGRTVALLDSPTPTLTRLTADGAADTTFGTNGFTAAPDAEVIHVDGRDQVFAVSVGYSSQGAVTSATLARYTADGTLDETYGTAGAAKIAVTDAAVGGGATGVVADPYDFAIASDGSVVVVGAAEDSAHNTRAFIERFTPAGAVDTTFNKDAAQPGVVVTADAGFGGVALGSDGSVVAASDVDLVKLAADGSADAAFGTAGKVAVPARTIADALTQGADGTLYVGLEPDGTAAGGKAAVAKYSAASGALVSGWANGGVATLTHSVWDTQEPFVEKVLVSPAGRAYVLIGLYNSGSDGDPFVVDALDASGAIDQSFGGSGTVVVDGSELSGSRAFFDDYGAATLAGDGSLELAGAVGDSRAADPYADTVGGLVRVSTPESPVVIPPVPAPAISLQGQVMASAVRITATMGHVAEGTTAEVLNNGTPMTLGGKYSSWRLQAGQTWVMWTVPVKAGTVPQLSVRLTPPSGSPVASNVVALRAAPSFSASMVGLAKAVRISGKFTDVPDGSTVTILWRNGTKVQTIVGGKSWDATSLVNNPKAFWTISPVRSGYTPYLAIRITLPGVGYYTSNWVHATAK